MTSGEVVAVVVVVFVVDAIDVVLILVVVVEDKTVVDDGDAVDDGTSDDGTNTRGVVCVITNMQMMMSTIPFGTKYGPYCMASFASTNPFRANQSFYRILDSNTSLAVKTK